MPSVQCPQYNKKCLIRAKYALECIRGGGGPFNTRGEGMVFSPNHIIRKHNISFLPDQKQTIFFLRYHRQTFFSRTCLNIHSAAKRHAWDGDV